MDYQEFREKLGKITVPEGEVKDRLIHGIDSIHYVCVVGEVVDGEYYMYNPVPESALLCLRLVELLESRGAERDNDYIIGINLHERDLRLGVHSTHDFLNDEDFDKNIKRYGTK